MANPPRPTRVAPRDAQRTVVLRARRLERLRWSTRVEPRSGAPADADTLLAAFPRSERYEPLGVLGHGGQGVVYRVRDAELDREAALKTVRRATEVDPDECIEEARATARLGHPNIVPIFEAGRLPDGRPYYTMQLVTGRSLEELLQDLFAEQEALTPGPVGREWTLVRLVQALQQTCNAVQLAHENGVLHRDIKPANVMLGSFGEVLLVDWGIAKRTGPPTGRGPASSPGSSDRAEATGGLRGSTADETAFGIVKGTVAYMSPEQAAGRPLGARSDVYALGVVLYEILTLHRPFEGASVPELLESIAHEPPLPPELVAGQRGANAELAELAIACLAKNPADRPDSAREVAEALQAHVEGVTDHARRLDAANAVRDEAGLALRRHEATEREIVALDARIDELEKAHPPWQDLSEKRPLIEARLRRDELQESSWTSYLDGVNRLTDALAHVPDHPEVRARLADLFWERCRRAEHQGRHLEMVTYRKLTERFHDGRLARELDGAGTLRLVVEPSDAELNLHEQVRDGLRLVDGPPRRLAPSPRGEVLTELPMGSYVIVARSPGRQETRYPLAIERCGRWDGALRLPRPEEIPEGFVHVPGAEVWLGGDALAFGSWPLRRVRVASFAMGRHPITFGEYCEFLAACADREDLDRLVPATHAEGPLCARQADGCWKPFAGLELTPHFLECYGEAALARVPVFGVDRRGVEAYISWRRDRDGRALRLPSGEEWELAARGADRRTHPWGPGQDPALCHLRDSFRAEPDIAPVGTFPTDEGPHGVRDLAGAIREWTSSWLDAERGLVELRGGAWLSGIQRAALRGQAEPNTRDPAVGFRLACDLPGS